MCCNKDAAQTHKHLSATADSIPHGHILKGYPRDQKERAPDVTAPTEHWGECPTWCPEATNRNKGPGTGEADRKWSSAKGMRAHAESPASLQPSRIQEL